MLAILFKSICNIVSFELLSCRRSLYLVKRNEFEYIIGSLHDTHALFHIRVASGLRLCCCNAHLSGDRSKNHRQGENSYRLLTCLGSCQGENMSRLASSRHSGRVSIFQGTPRGMAVKVNLYRLLTHSSDRQGENLSRLTSSSHCE